MVPLLSLGHQCDPDNIGYSDPDNIGYKNILNKWFINKSSRF